MTTLQEALDRIAQLEAEAAADQSYLQDVIADYRETIYSLEREIRSLEAELEEVRYNSRMGLDN